MARPTTQTQRAIDKLKAAGFDRSEFKVRTERINYHRHPDTGKQMYEYGDALIYLRADKEKALHLAEAMADQGLFVEISILAKGKFAGKKSYPHVWDCKRYGWFSKGPGVYVHDFRQKDSHGFATVKQIYKGKTA